MFAPRPSRRIDPLPHRRTDKIRKGKMSWDQGRPQVPAVLLQNLAGRTARCLIVFPSGLLLDLCSAHEPSRFERAIVRHELPSFLPSLFFSPFIQLPRQCGGLRRTKWQRNKRKRLCTHQKIHNLLRATSFFFLFQDYLLDSFESFCAPTVTNPGYERAPPRMFPSSPAVLSVIHLLRLCICPSCLLITYSIMSL